MTRPVGLVLLLVLPAVGAACGWLAGPSFARAHDRVTLAARIWEEDSRDLPPQTEETKAFRDTDRPLRELAPPLYAEARGIVRQFRLGTALFGLWSGLVVGFKLLAFAGDRSRSIYEIHPAQCVACGRCFLSCPREHARLKRLAELKA